MQIDLKALESVFVGSSIVALGKAKKAPKTRFNGILVASLDCVSCADFRFCEVCAHLHNFAK